MDDRVLLKVYYFGQILLQTSEDVKFICENPLDVAIPFIISFEELKGVICEKMDSEMSRRISCILYRYSIPVFGGFVQFEASLQEMFSMYIESRAQILSIELYVEFEQSEADRNIIREDYNSDSEEEFESNYEVIGPDGDEDQGDGIMVPDVVDVANALANEVPFEEPSFMRVLDLDVMHVPEFLEYMSAGTILCLTAFVGKIPIVADGEFAVGMEFSSREAVIKAMKEYTIRRSVYELEPLTFYAKCTQYGSGCDWLVRVSMISRKHCWVIRRYNGSHTCTRATISLDHSKPDSVIRGRCASTKCVTSDQETSRSVALTGRIRCLRCVRCQVDYNMPSTSGDNDVIVVSSKWTGFLVAMYLHLVQINDWRLDSQAYVHDMYKMDQFRPLENPTTWPAYNGPRFVPNPFLRHVTKGRPRMTHFLNEIDTRMLRHPRQCRQCRDERHSRSRYRQTAGANADGDAQ
ncbi:hypothetical protein Ahy_B04g069697 [Arachis hypogaea]|uniref:Transposase MuDR plant domain-containing protein n=1 Tax=Arachis hypogaea TaxID=3818 RepID=A0A444ZDB1_ARAHY|nr:hypothetical protein Ahy_B04g069697 [Arachis hypogaea]